MIGGVSMSDRELETTEASDLGDDVQEAYIFPVSYAQQRLWLLAQIEPESPAYHICDGFRIRGELDADLLEQSLAALMERHEALRTTFSVMEGEPVQVVAPERSSGLVRRDLSGFEAGEQEAEIRRIAAEEARRPFDLIRGPLVRFLLLHLAPEHHLLIITFHHLIADAWSEEILARELFTVYAAGGDASDLPEIEIQYGDFAQWEKEVLEGELLEALLGYWSKQLEGVSGVLDLPTDRPRPEEPSYRGDHVGFSVPEDVAKSLKDLGRGEKATPYAVFLAAFGVLIGRLSGEKDVTIGSPATQRNQVELEGLIGLFLNTLVLRVDFRDLPSFRELLRRTRETVYGAQEHQELPFERLVMELAPERDRSRSPLFQVLFNFENTPPREASEVGGLAVEPFQIDTGSAKLDLMLNLLETPDGLVGSFEFSTDLFERATIERLVDSLVALLRGVVENPDRSVAELPLLSTDERERLLVDWNDTERADLAEEALVHELVAEAAASHGDAVAVRSPSQKLTFDQLMDRAHRVAQILRREGVGPDEPVGVYLDRGPELVAAFLGVLEAGGAFLPLDPDLPEDRIRFLLDDSGARTVIAEERLRASVGDDRRVLVPSLAELESLPAEAPETPVRADNLAYIIYTSGSTGRPKGVMVSHRGAASYLRFCRDHYPTGRAAGALLHGSPSFDLTITSLFGPLICGRAIHILPQGADVEALTRALADSPGFNFVKLTPSHLEILSRSLPAEGAADVADALLLGGEALTAESLGFWRENAPEMRLINEYGPTETVVGCAIYEVAANDPATGAVAIGRPIPNTRLYVLDPRLQPVPQGAVGELYIGGLQVTRGYLGRSGLTAERFFPDPFATSPGGRLYKTGDLVRHRADGELVYLGRGDEQLKVHGWRIEPGEIEAVLLEHPAVREAAVVAREIDGTKRLVAYIVRDGDVQADALRGALLEKLPQQMVPSSFVPLEALPLSASGKLDRQALPAPDVKKNRQEMGQRYIAPRNVVEDTLASIYSQVLGVEEVGINDNFFTLGGDSIRSLSVVGLARQKGLQLSLRQVALHPTVADLAHEIETGGGEDEGDAHTEPFSLVSEEDRAKLPEDVVDAYPLGSMQAGMIYHQELTPNAPLFHSINSHLHEMPLDEEKYQEAVLRVTARHPNLRTSFALTGYSEPLQLVHREPVFPVAFHDLRHLSEEEQETALHELWEAEKNRPFDLTTRPQLRFHIHRRRDDAFQFTLTENHAIIDGWSLHLVFEEILTTYFALLEDEEPPELPPLETTLRDFVHLERQAAESAEHRRYWEEKMRGYTVARLPLLPGHEAPSEGHRVWRRDTLFPPKLIRGLRRIAREEAVPLKSVLLAAHSRVMSFITGQNDIVTGLSSNGRPATEDSDRVAGVFLNTLPLRLDVAGGSWRDLIHATYEAELEMLPYRRYPLASIQRSWGQEPIFDTSVVYLNFHVMGDLIRSKKVGYVEAGEMIEETNFAVMTAFLHIPGSKARVVLSLCCDRWLFTDEQILAIEGYYLKALEAIAEDPAGRYDHFDFLSEAEKQQLLAEWSAPRKALEEAPLFPARFAEHVASTPDALALAHEDEELTYGELAHRARQLARHLQGLGIGAESRVLLAFERSTDTVVALLAVLEAGGAYIPVDLSFPDERIAFMVEDSGAAAILTRDGERSRFADAGVTIVALDADAAAIGEKSGEPLETTVDPGHLAYVIYTSGTTGRSKGVGVEHRHLASYVESVVRDLGLPAGGRHALVSTFGADLGNTMIFPALATGGVLEVVSEARATQPAELAELAGRRPYDALKIVPSHLGALLSHDEPEVLLPRRCLVLGGEALPVEIVEQVEHLAPDCRILNHYGPTEATVGAIAGAVTSDELTASLAPPLGRPLANARIYVADRFFELASLGTAGELLIGGDGVARGYLGQSALTAEKFVPDPWRGEPGARLYRTGDLARFLPDGRLDFLGRIDHQVKIRGFRVELGEIEAALVALPEVAEAAVLARGEKGDLRLVAYVIPTGDGVDEGALRAALDRSLPEPMVPQAFVALERFPLTPNGKLDRAALPAPDSLGADTTETAESRAPRNEIEAQLVEAWKKVLKVDDVGVFDSFFDLGGDSIKSIVVISQVRKLFGVNLPMESLFEAETVAGLAGKVEIARQQEQRHAETTTVGHAPRDGELPLSRSQQRLWYEWMLHPESPAYNVPYAFKVRGKLDEAAWIRSLEAIVARHEVLRSRFLSEDGEPRLVIDEAPRLESRSLDLRDLEPGERQREAERLGSEEGWRPFDLEKGPLLRSLLIRLDEEETGVLITIHHIAFDGWSIGVFMRELEIFYAAFRDGETPRLEELPHQYVDYAHWQRQELQGETLEKHLGYWRERLAGVSALEMPTDHPRPETRSFRGDTEFLDFPQALSETLKRTSQREGTTLFMTLYAAFATLLGHHAGQEDFVIGVPVAAARDREEFDKLIGMFLNTLPLRADLSGNPTFRELLSRSRRVALEGYAHQHIPFEMLVDEVAPDRELGHNPLFQVWLNHSTVPQSPPELADLTLAPFDVGSAAVKFDLVLSTEEIDGRLVAWLGYSTDLFDRSTVQDLLAELALLLGWIAERPAMRLEELRERLTAAREMRREARRRERKTSRGRGLKRATRRSVALDV